MLVHNDNGQCSVDKDGSKTDSGKVNPNVIMALVKQVPDEYKVVFKCVEFKNSLVKMLKTNKIKGEVIGVNRVESDVILSDSLKQEISKNGYHCGVKIDNMIYDNLHPNGITYDDWRKDLLIDDPNYGISTKIEESWSFE